MAGSATGRSAAGTLSLEEFMLVMSRQSPADLEHERLADYVRRLSLSDDTVSSRTRFSAGEYARNLVCRTPEFELLVLCWRGGQRSTIHDHGGSLNVIRVHRGQLTQRLFDPAMGVPPHASGPVRLISEQTLAPGTELAGIDRQGIHQLVNATTDDLVTVHVYAPPLMRLTVYSEDSPMTESRPLRYTLADDVR